MTSYTTALTAAKGCTQGSTTVPTTALTVLLVDGVVMPMAKMSTAVFAMPESMPQNAQLDASSAIMGG